MHWSLFYNDLYWLDLPSGVSVVGHTDGGVVLATVHNTPIIENALNPALEQITGWLICIRLGLAAEKTEAVMLTNKWVYSPPVVWVDGYWIPFGRTIRYLGVHLDTRWSFGPYVW